MDKISRLVQGIFAGIFFLTIVAIIVRGCFRFNPLGIAVAVISGIAYTAFVVWFYGFLYKHLKNAEQKRLDRIFIVIALCVLALQIVFAICLKTKPVSDYGYIDNAARDFCKSWNSEDLYLHLPERHQNYFARYPNNHAMLIMVSIIYFFTDRLFGVTPTIAPIAVNVALLFLSYILMYLISKKLFADKVLALYTAIIGAGFSVFYTYTAYYYTDSFSMPFVLGSIYLFLIGFEGKNRKTIIICLSLSMLLLIWGYKLKGSAIILLPAILIYMIYFTKKYNLKRHLKQLGVMLIAFVVSVAMCGSFINAFNIATDEQEQQSQFPLIHWVMMGLHGNGGYYDKDFWYTEHSGNYKHKEQADIKRMEERIANYGVGGMLWHFAKKVTYTWGNGSYFISKYVRDGDNNFLRYFVSKSIAFKWCFCTYQFMLLIMILLSFIIGTIRKKSGKEILLKIIICGVFIFFLLWEARSRYLVNFSPLFIILAAFTTKELYFTTKRKILLKNLRHLSKNRVNAANHRENSMNFFKKHLLFLF